MTKKAKAKEPDSLWEAFIEAYPITGTLKEKVDWLADLREKSKTDCAALVPEVIKLRSHRARYRNSHTVPFGYIADKEHSWLLWPIPEHIYALNKAIDYVTKSGIDYRRAAAWLSERTGRRIGHTGLRSIIVNRKKSLDKQREEAKWYRQKQKLEKLMKELR